MSEEDVAKEIRESDENVQQGKAKYKLYYFDARGKGEIIRVALHFLNISFHDNRIPIDSWGKNKKSRAVAEEKAYFGGKTKLEQARVDMHTAWIFDLLEALARIQMSEVPDNRPEKMKDFGQTTLVHFLDAFSKLIEKQGTFLIGKNFTYLDCAFITFYKLIKEPFKEQVSNYGLINDYFNRSILLPTLQPYIEAHWTD
uniref:GST C-terminal domain-containing protein n=1 Tax=Rhabditophanes sp. KR3021 TaxID=114890 RepID=A0AC35TZ14_9BILA